MPSWVSCVVVLEPLWWLRLTDLTIACRRRSKSEWESSEGKWRVLAATVEAADTTSRRDRQREDIHTQLQYTSTTSLRAVDHSFPLLSSHYIGKAGRSYRIRTQVDRGNCKAHPYAFYRPGSKLIKLVSRCINMQYDTRYYVIVQFLYCLAPVSPVFDDGVPSPTSVCGFMLAGGIQALH